MSSHLCLSLFIFIFLSITTTYAAADNRPGIIVEETVNQVLQVLTDQNLSEQEKKNSTYTIVIEYRSTIKSLSIDGLLIQIREQVNQLSS